MFEIKFIFLFLLGVQTYFAERENEIKTKELVHMKESGAGDEVSSLNLRTYINSLSSKVGLFYK